VSRWLRKRQERRMTASQVMDRNVREGRDPWRGIATHAPHVARERLPQAGPHPAAAPLGWAVVVPPSAAFLSRSLPAVEQRQERAA
jgi:hypothetical protein